MILKPRVETKNESTDEPTVKRLTPFDFVKDIEFEKKNLIVDQATERAYSAFVINKAMSFGADTVFQADEMNRRAHIPPKCQNLFMLGTVAKKKRFNRWIKKEQDESIEIIMKVFGYNERKAMDVVKLFDKQQIEEMKKLLYTGGV